MTTPIVGRPPVVNDDGDQDTVYADWVEFHTHLLSQLFARDPDPTIDPGWCPEWRQHYAADYTVMSLWRAWEGLQLDPSTGQASWLVNLAIPAMTWLMADPGPFSGCSTDRHDPIVQPLPRDDETAPPQPEG